MVTKINEIKEADMVDISINPLTIEALVKGGFVDVTVKAGNTGDWVAVYNSTWFSLSKNKGFGESEITITIKPNNTGEERSGTVIFKYASEADEDGVVLTINQKHNPDAGGGDEPEPEPQLVKNIYYPSSYPDDNGTVSLENGEESKSVTSSYTIYENFDFSKIEDTVWIEVPNVNVRVFDDGGSPDANDISITYSIIEKNSSKVIASTYETFDSKGRYSFKDITFTPQKDVRYSLKMEYTVWCENPQRNGGKVEYDFTTEENMVHYKYFE
jgi:hypothetical protein